jgi:hypothetical protein
VIDRRCLCRPAGVGIVLALGGCDC